jgi:Pentapeptide repeats (8 copies)
MQVLKRWGALPRGTRWALSLVAAVIIGLAIVWALFVPIADWLATHDVGRVTGTLRALRLQTAKDAARGRLLTLGAGVLAAGALWFTARNFVLSREGQVTDRYGKAIEQLGAAADKLDVRIGGIYALERVARDSPRDHPTVMEVLAAFVREHSHERWPVPESDDAATPERTTRPDVQAALRVIGRREVRHDRLPIDLSRADLTRADLTNADLGEADLTDASLTAADLTSAHLRGADLISADFTDADLTGAHLTGAHLTGAHLNGVALTGAHLRGADLISAHLTGAHLYEADLTGASLYGADLTGADLTGADLTGANLTHADLGGADLTGADLTDTNLGDADLAGAIWPQDVPPSEGWAREADSGRLRRAGEDPGDTDS